jgi:DNA-binding CsgD family transcriptional regulator
LNDIIADCRQGDGHIVLVDGPPATGKSTLLRQVAGDATGFLPLTATCPHAERSLPFGLLSQLLHAAGPARFTDLLDRIAAIAPEQDDLDQVRLSRDLCLALLELAADTPLLIGIDDIQYADEPSRQCLLRLAGRVDQVPLLVVVTDDGDPLATRTAFRADLVRLPSSTRLHLRPLSEQGTSALLRDRLGDAADELTPDFFAATGGNPLLVSALSDDRLADDTGLSTYLMAFIGCLHHGDGLLMRSARVRAVLGKDAATADVAALVGIDEDVAERLHNTMCAAGLMTEDGFRDESVAAAVRDGLPKRDRAALHRRAAVLLHERDASPTDVAEHLIEAGESTQPWAGPVLAEATEQALVADHVDLATRCIEHIPSQRQQESNLASVRARLARAEWEADPSAAVRHAETLSDASRADRLDQRDSVMVVRQLLWHGRTKDATAVLDTLRRRAADTTEVRDAEQWLACTHPALVRHRTAARGDQLAPGTDPWLRVTATLASALSGGPGTDAVEQAEEVLRDIHFSRDTLWADEAATFALLTLVAADRVDTAAAWCARLRRVAESRDSATWRAVFAALSGDVAIRRGDFTSAAEYAEAALTELTPAQWGVAIGLPLGVAILANTRLGRYQAAATLLAQPVPDETFASRYGLHYLHARGHYHLETRHWHAALADFLTCGDLMRDWALDLTGLIPWRTSAAEAWQRLGNLDQAKQLIQDQLTRSAAGSARTRALSLRLLAATSPVRRRPQLLAEALELQEDCGDQFEQARVLADLGRAHGALDDARRARTVFRRAWYLAGRCDAAPLRGELVAVHGDFEDTTDGETPEVADSLTGSERRVAWLAVMGYKNREIADRLYVTPSTVEQHLTRVYRKLNVRGRHDLPGDLQVTPAGAPEPIPATHH